MKTVFTLSIECIAGRHLTQPYGVVVDFSADTTLGELARFVLGAVDFDGDHLSDYYLANAPRGKKTWFTDDGEWDDVADDTSADLRLAALFPLPKHKTLYYAYDAGASWLFEIRKKGRDAAPLAGRIYPHVVAQHGQPPLEYGEDDE